MAADEALSVEATDGAQFLRELDTRIKEGWTVTSTKGQWRWRQWGPFGRWVFYYMAQLAKQSQESLRFNFGPVSERPIPMESGPQE